MPRPTPDLAVLAARRAEAARSVARATRAHVPRAGLVRRLQQATHAELAAGAVIRIPARLRYRLAVGGGAVAWHYQLYRVEHWMRAEIQAALARVAEATGLPAYEGTPEVSAR